MDRSKKYAKPSNTETKKSFLENPFDLETVFESLNIASSYNKELIFMDRFIATIRLDPEGDITNITYKILCDLKMITLETD
jgi:hypothetical protein